MEYILSGLLGYGLGCLNPAYFIGKANHMDIREAGTGNPGTTNAFITLGRGWGCFVLCFDVMKAFVAVRLCQWLFPALALAGILAGCGAVAGHMFPFYLNFHGGKGIACFGGFILTMDWKLFLLLLAIGCVLALVVNYGCAVSYSAAFLFPVFYAAKIHSVAAFGILLLCSSAIIYRHAENIRKIRAGKEMTVLAFLYRYILRR